jgi:homocysteine S-methyltransferase
MSKYRKNLPQFGERIFLADSGLETTLIFHNNFDLPCFASFVLLGSPAGEQVITEYYRRHGLIAARHGAGFVAESATWRASRDWGSQLGYSPDALDEANRKAVALLHGLVEEFEPTTPLIISGSVGPRGDGYNPDSFMSADEAAAYHSAQVNSLARAGADIVSAMTMTYAEEAIGIAEAARSANMPVSVSVTVETDGRLPSGMTIGQAVETIDGATGGYPAYFMINCAHPDHFDEALAERGNWKARIYGVRANASRMSHAELDNATALDDGDPAELGDDYRRLMRQLPNLRILGGCCGTDHRHIEAIADNCLHRQAA